LLTEKREKKNGGRTFPGRDPISDSLGPVGLVVERAVKGVLLLHRTGKENGRNANIRRAKEKEPLPGFPKKFSSSMRKREEPSVYARRMETGFSHSAKRHFAVEKRGGAQHVGRRPEGINSSESKASRFKKKGKEESPCLGAIRVGGGGKRVNSCQGSFLVQLEKADQAARGGGGGGGGLCVL